MSLNVFNESLMNDAVYKFKRYEDASLVYTGIDRHEGEDVGLYSRPSAAPITTPWRASLPIPWRRPNGAWTISRKGRCS